jgi:hypothetical protein
MTLFISDEQNISYKVEHYSVLYVNFNTNLLHNDVYLLTIATTCFGLNNYIALCNKLKLNFTYVI